MKKTYQGIQSREVEVNVEKCTSKEKAEIALGKMFKKAIVNVLECVFYVDKRVMSDSDFAKYSTVKERVILTEEDVAKINDSRKRGK